MEQIVIMQFGSHCLSDASSFEKIMEIIQKYTKNKLILVACALPGILDLLEDCANKANTCSSYAHDINLIKRQHLNLVNFLLKDPYKMDTQNFLNDKFLHLIEILEDIEEYGLSNNKIDIVLSFGEILSGYILNKFLLSNKIESEYLLGDRFLITDSRYNNALPIMNITVRKVRTLLLPLLKLDHLPVVTGFIGRNRAGHLTTLGVGGAEFTAALIGYCLKDENYETKVILWKKVDGILTADPGIVPSARTIRQLSYAEAKEIAIGTKVFHPKSIQPIQNREIPLEIRNFYNPSSTDFTVVQKQPTSQKEIIAITYQDEVAMISAISESTVEIPGVLAKIFDLMGRNQINITMISQSSSEIDTTFVIKAEDGESAKRLLSDSDFFKEWFEIRVAYVSMISIIGEGVNKPRNFKKIFNALEKCGMKIHALSQASDGLNVTLLIPKNNLNIAIETLHKEFELDNN